MSLAEAIQASQSRKGPSCTVPGILDTLEDGDRATFDQAVNERVQWSTLADALNAVFAKHGLDRRISAYTLSRHHRRKCMCS